MKNNLLKFYLLAFFLISDFVVFAQPGTGEDEDCTDCPDLEGGDNIAPIDSKLIYLAIIGVAFAFYYFSKKRAQQVN